MATLIALGAPLGAEQIGWEVADILRRHKIANIHTCRHPIDLLPYFEENQNCIVLDSVNSLKISGTLNLIDPDDLDPSICRKSLGLNLYEVLQLAKISEQLPPSFRLLTIDIGPQHLHYFAPHQKSEMAYRVAEELDLEVPLLEEFHDQ